MLVPQNTNTKARCTGDDESAPNTYLLLPYFLTYLAGPDGAIGRITYRLDPRIGPLHREPAWLGVGLRAD